MVYVEAKSLVIAHILYTKIVINLFYIYSEIP